MLASKWLGNPEAVICEVRYDLDANGLEGFKAYASAWIGLIEKHGGIHFGFYLPRGEPEGSPPSYLNIGRAEAGGPAVAMFAFANEESYRRYRAAVQRDPEATGVIERFKNPPFLTYTRRFLRPI